MSFRIRGRAHSTALSTVLVVAHRLLDDLQPLDRHFTTLHSERVDRIAPTIHVLEAAVQAVLPPLTARPLIAVELGGLVPSGATPSTAAIPSALARRGVPWRFLSLATPEQYDLASRLMASLAPQLLFDVEFVQLRSLQELPAALDTIGPIDFAWLDGARSPEIGSCDIQALVERLSDGGLLMVNEPPDTGALDSTLSPQRPDSASGQGRNEIAFSIIERFEQRLLVAGAASPLEKLLTLVCDLGFSTGTVRHALVPRPAPHTKASTLVAHFTRADDVRLRACWRVARRTFPLITPTDFARALGAVLFVDERIQGRHCGDLGDKLTQYLAVVQHVRATRTTKVDVLEIGTLFGGSCLMNLIAMRDCAVDGRVTCIDPLSGYYGAGADPISGMPVDETTLYRNLASCGFSPQSIDLRSCRSSDARATDGLEPGTFAVLMIDGDHSGAGVRQDWARYHPYVSGRGVILIDDYAEPGWPEIVVAADEIAASNPEWSAVGTFGTTLILSRDPGARQGASRGPAAHSHPYVGSAFKRTNGETSSPTLSLVARELSRTAGETDDILGRMATVAEHLRQWSELDVQLNLARTAFARKEWTAAERGFRDVIARGSVSPKVVVWAWIGLGDCLSQQGDDRGAFECLETAAALERRFSTYGYPRHDAIDRERRAQAAQLVARTA